VRSSELLGCWHTRNARSMQQGRRDGSKQRRVQQWVAVYVSCGAAGVAEVAAVLCGSFNADFGSARLSDCRSVVAPRLICTPATMTTILAWPPQRHTCCGSCTCHTSLTSSSPAARHTSPLLHYGTIPQHRLNIFMHLPSSLTAAHHLVQASPHRHHAAQAACAPSSA
jgi:hypothetical protein